MQPTQPPLQQPEQPPQKPEPSEFEKYFHNLDLQVEKEGPDKLRETRLELNFGLDPLAIVKAYENKVQNSINQRLAILESVRAEDYSEKIARKIKIERLSLKLVDYQKHLRKDFVKFRNAVTSIDTGLDLRSFRIHKKFTLRDSRCADKLERQKRYDIEQHERDERQKFVARLQQHCTDFINFHRSKVFTPFFC